MPMDDRKGEPRLEGKPSSLSERVHHLTPVLSLEADPSEPDGGQYLLRESEERLRFALEGFGAGTWDYRPDRGEVIYDEGVLRLLGYGRDTPLLDPTTWSDLLHPEDRKSVGVGLERFLNGEENSYESLFRLRTKSGEWRWMRSRGKAVARNNKGAVTRMVGVLFDVTDRKGIEDEIAERLRFESLVSDLSAAFVNIPDAEILDEIERWLEVLAKFLKVDACIVWDSLPDRNLELLRGFKTADYPGFPDREVVSGSTWYGDKMRTGDIVVLENLPDALPAEACEERLSAARRGVRAFLGFPMMMAGNLIGALTISSMHPRSWSRELVSRARLISEIFAGALQRVRAADELKFRREFESLVANLSIRFLNLSASEIDAEIKQTLARTGSFLDVDRAHVYLIRDDGEFADNTHEWVREGIASRQLEMQGVAVADFAYERQLFEAGKLVVLDDSLEAFPEKDVHRDRLHSIGVRSSVSAPLMRGERLIGSVGFALERSARRWESSTIAMLRVIAEMIGGALERKRSEEALQLEKERAQLYLDVAGVVLVALDTDGRITMINRKGCGLLGYDEQELLERNWFDTCLLDEDREATREVFKKLVTGDLESVEYHENKIITSAGEHRVVAWHNTLVWDANGRISGTLSSGEDITERRRATEELRRSEVRFRSLVEQTSEAIFCYEYDPPIPMDLPVSEQVRRLYEGALAECNDVAARSYGANTADEVVGRRLIDLLRARPRGLGELFQQFIEGGCRIAGGEATESLPDGTKLYRQYSARGVIEDGMLHRVWGTFHDITELKRSENELRDSEQRFRKVVEQAADSFYLITLDGAIVDVNQQACESVGYTRDELLAMNLAEIDLAFADTVRRAQLQRELSPGKSVTIQSAHRRKDGRIFPAEIRVGLLELAGQQYVLGLSRDTTERQRMQEAMIQSEKMMTVGGLAAGMAHEINNPLSGILQGIQNAQRRLSPDFHANLEVAAECGIDLVAMNDYLERREVLDFLKGIQLAGTRAARIIRNMLQFSRPGLTERTPTDCGELLDRTMELATADFDLKKKYDFRDIRVERLFDPNLSEVPCVATELEQVILNILKNAAEAMSEQEERVEPRRLTLRTLRESEWARIEIEDNGPGMDEGIRRRVFEPFFTTKEVGSGTGLGLSVSYFIITNNHRGTIDVESRPGGGAKFVIRLPLR